MEIFHLTCLSMDRQCSENSVHTVVIFAGDRVEFVIVASRTSERNAHDAPSESV